MSDIGYPLVKCYHPRHIQNKYTGQVIEVGCGVCKACLQQRASKLSFLCSMEEIAHKYCMFVTLTYSDDYIPKMYPEYDEELNIVKWISYCHRLGDAGKVISVDYGDWHKTKDIRGYLSLLQYKCNLDGYLSYPSKRDIQLFLKRLRKNLSKYTDEKIRYYAVSEYGPKTFRAHYHCYYSMTRKRRKRLCGKLYIRVGCLVVSTPLYREASVIHTLRDILIAIILFPDFLELCPRSRSRFILGSSLSAFIAVRKRNI